MRYSRGREARAGFFWTSAAAWARVEAEAGGASVPCGLFSQQARGFEKLWRYFEAAALALRGAPGGGGAVGEGAALMPRELTLGLLQERLREQWDPTGTSALVELEWPKALARRNPAHLPHRHQQGHTTEAKLAQVVGAAVRHVAPRLLSALGASGSLFDYLCDFVVCQVMLTAVCEREKSGAALGLACDGKQKQEEYDALNAPTEPLRPAAYAASARTKPCEPENFDLHHCKNEVHFNAALFLRALMTAVPSVAVRYNAMLKFLCPDLRGGGSGGGGGAGGEDAWQRAHLWQRGVRNRFALSLAMTHSALLGLPPEHVGAALEPSPPISTLPYPVSEVWALLARWRAEMLAPPGGAAGGGSGTRASPSRACRPWPACCCTLPGCCGGTMACPPPAPCCRTLPSATRRWRAMQQRWLPWMRAWMAA